MKKIFYLIHGVQAEEVEAGLFVTSIIDFFNSSIENLSSIDNLLFFGGSIGSKVSSETWNSGDLFGGLGRLDFKLNGVESVSVGVVNGGGRFQTPIVGKLQNGSTC